MSVINVMFIDQSARMGGAEKKVLLDLLENVDRSRVNPILVSPSGDLVEKGS
ncbi:hypothetical protein GCM10020331_024470 [Ectobacillus funiculus]